ncbi:hypothetical protein KO525_07790 [Psychrosphaera sp. B3R10]|uniref:hypothetical protein n=1 Tax=unclassified Psychrosphaera TaxID=2641570 RepID=UPI001C0A414B|nr:MULTISPECIES: hypothetical protein [unclassified Psychrosphaera]MBU2882710.1 hypothetical protein [Psychrosphaera sp. I2R16]MBU2989271.1 hypothetical protein [Psychrosphaera sp. B3R10]
MKSMLPAFLQKLLNRKSNGLHVGIAIHKEVVRVVMLEQGEKGMLLNTHFDVAYSSEDQLPNVLETIIKENDIVSGSISIVLPSHRSQSTQIEITELPEQDIQEALPWKLKDLISIPPLDMVCDYIDMPLQPFGQTPKAQIIATSRSYLQKILEPFHDAGANVLEIFTEQFAVAKLQRSENTAQLVFLQHAKSDAIILILKNQQICFARKIRGAEALNTMTPEQIQMGGTDNVAVEIQRSIDYYEGQLKQPPIKNVFIAIDSANIQAIVDALDLSLPVKSKPFSFDEIANDLQLSLKFIPALGAAMSTVVERHEEDVSE